MKKVIVLILLLCFATCKASAAELNFTAPPVPEVGEEFLIGEPENFLDGLRSILKEALAYIYPAFTEAAGICTRVIGIMIILSVIDCSTFPILSFVKNIVCGNIIIGNDLKWAITILRISSI